jgi:diguanylate cyclase (GGDEF)-like protein/PAS domain S-box-containing protein
MQQQSAELAGSLPSLLVVHKEPLACTRLHGQLRELGYQVCGCVDNGHEALLKARAGRPDLVLMDFTLKGEMDSIATAAAIGSELHIPVLYLTTHNDDQAIEHAARTWSYGYLAAPFHKRELRARIEVALSKAGTERALRNSERWLASVLNGVGDSVIATDAEGFIRLVNPAAERLLGCSASAVQGRPAGEVIGLEDARSGQPTPLAFNGGTVASRLAGAAVLVGRDGARVPVDVSAGPIGDEQGQPIGAALVLHDMREHVAAEQRLAQSEHRFRSAFDNAPLGLALVDRDNRFVRVNHALCRLLGATAEQLVGAEQARFGDPEDLAIEKQFQGDLLAGRSVAVQFDRRYRTHEGELVWALVSATLLPANGEPSHFLVQIHDLTERKRAEDELAHLAHHDGLTGVANRMLLAEEVEHELALARRHQRRLAVVFIDLDYFKHINDSLGHEAGDTVLKEIAARLAGAVRESDIVGRMGGDEFVVVLSEVDDTRGVLALTDKLRTECARPVRLDGHEVQLSVSMGVSLFPDDAQDFRTLLRFADSALYHAKAEGRDNVQFYLPELTARMEMRLRLAAGLRVALERHELELYYQPIMSLDNDRPAAAEALIRWNHPELGLLLPDTFLPVLNELSMGEPVGAWAIGEACQRAARWNAGRAAPLRVGVNVTAAQFKSGTLVQTVERALRNAGLAGNCLCIEITEQHLLGDSEHTRATMAALKALGVHVAIDDFGTGYSSLSYISRFRPSELKIDQSLIADVDTDSERAALVIAALAMARSLKLQVVTEGVETEAELAFLRANGCDMAQGYLYARPCPAADFDAWLARHGGA